MELKTAASLTEGFLKEQQITKYSYTVSQSEKQEQNLENRGFKLIRTVYSGGGSLRDFLGNRTGSASGNDMTEQGLKKLVEDAKAAAESAEEDPCHDLAPDQGRDVFRQGTTEEDPERFIGRIREFLETV